MLNVIKFCFYFVIAVILLLPSYVSAQVYDGSLSLSTQAQIDDFNYTSVTGGIRIDDQDNPGSIRNLDGLSELTSIGGNLVLFWTDSLPNVDGLNNLTTIGNFLAIRFTTITNLNGLSNLTSVKNVWLDANMYLTDISGLDGISTLDTLWVTWNSNLTDLSGFTNVTGAIEDLAIFRNRLTDLDDLSGITSVADSIVIAYEQITNLDGLSNISSLGINLEIFNNPSIERFCGIYNLLSNGFAGTYSVYSNSYNPTQQEIIDCGPCSGISGPFANAGNDMTVIVGGTVNLDGSDSSDPNNDPLTYNWNIWIKPFESTSVLSDNTNVAPTFTADLPGNYVVRLNVFDGCALSGVDQVTITAITVEDASEEITDGVEGLPLSDGNKNALKSKLDNAIASYNRGNLIAAINLLNAFINQLNQFVANGGITAGQAQPLLDYANMLIASINASLPKMTNDGSNGTVSEFGLAQNYPNPFNPITSINYSIPNSSFVQLVVYNSIGQEIANLVNGTIAAGNHNVEFNASNLPSGIYLYKLQAGSFVETKKMILMK